MEALSRSEARVLAGRHLGSNARARHSTARTVLPGRSCPHSPAPPQPQIKFVRPLSGQNDFVAYVDATGRLDNRDCLLEWKTTSARYPTEPDGLLALDP